MNQFRQYVVSRHGRERWVEMMAESGYAEDHYKLSEVYPDDQLTALVTSAASGTATPVSLLLEDFGAFLAPALLRVYAPLIPAEWRTLDVIAHTEENIHTVVRARMRGAAPPALISRRISPTLVELDYRSERNLCFVAKGIARGLAEHYGEMIGISEPECMHLGGERCLMLFEALPGESSPSDTSAGAVS